MAPVRVPCLGVTVDGRRVLCGTPVEKPAARCDVHQKIYEATRRPPPSRRGYDAQYRRERKELLKPDADGNPPRCQLRLPGCTGWATTADHDEPTSMTFHHRGKLTPACAHCNSSRGNRPYFPGSEIINIQDPPPRVSDETTSPAGPGWAVLPDGTVKETR